MKKFQSISKRKKTFISTSHEILFPLHAKRKTSNLDFINDRPRKIQPPHDGDHPFQESEEQFVAKFSQKRRIQSQHDLFNPFLLFFLVVVRCLGRFCLESQEDGKECGVKNTGLREEPPQIDV